MADVETATARPRSPVSAEVRARGHRIVQDKPPELGGEDKGPMASELLLASILSCQLSTFAKVKAKRRLDQVQAERLKASLHFDETGDIASVHLEWHLEAPDDVEDPALETLLRLTDQACTISKALFVTVTRELKRVARVA